MTIPAKAYIVKTYEGEWENSLEDIYAVCLTRETAERKLEEYEASHDPKKISKEVWNKLADEVEEYEDKTDEFFISFTEGILFLHGKDPNFKWTEEELRYAEDTYSDFPCSYKPAEIIEVDLFE